MTRSNRAREALLSVGDGGGSRGQDFPEVRLRDARLIANAMKATPLMPEPLQAVLRCHCVTRADAPVRVKMLSRFLGRRDREAMSRTEYWRLLDRSHYFLAGKIETPRAAGTTPLEVLGRGR